MKVPSPENIGDKNEGKKPLDLFNEAGLSTEEISVILKLTDASLESSGNFGEDSKICNVVRTSESTLTVVTEHWISGIMGGMIAEKTLSVEKKDGEWVVIDVVYGDSKQIALD